MSGSKISLKRTIISLNLYTFFTGMMFWYGIEQLFIDEIAGGVFGRGVLTAIWAIIYLLVNIPIGALSDIWGRLRSLRLGIIFMLAGLIVLATSNSLWQYCIGAILWAIYWSINEGPRQALLYDTLVDNDRGAEFERRQGQIVASLLIGAAVANLTSGFLAEQLGLRATYWLSAIPVIAAFICLSFIHEPAHHRQIGKKFLNQLKDIKGLVWEKAILRHLLVLGVACYVAIDIVGEFGQVVILEYTDSARILGILWMAIALIMAGGRWLSHHIKGRLNLVVAILLLHTTYLVFSSHVFGLAVYMVTLGIYEIVINKNDALIQKQTQSHLRASIGSVTSSISSLLIPLLAIYVGSSQIGTSIVGPISVVIYPLVLIVLVMTLLTQSKIKQSR